MRKRPTRSRRVTGWLLSVLVLMIYFSPQAQLLRSLPDTLIVGRGQLPALEAPFPLRVSVAAGASQDETLAPASATISLLGLIPIREVPIDVPDDLRLWPGGQAVGVALQTQGVLVVGTGDLSTVRSPAGRAGIRAGDVILEADGQPVTGTAALTQAVARAAGRSLPLTVLRGQTRLALTLTPVRDGEAGDWRIGAWVRDSTAGVGTLSYYGAMPAGDKVVYGALGHAITDSDTGRVLAVGAGEIMQADVVDVQRGREGFPGELKGSFLREDRVWGTISRNDRFGIGGEMTCLPAHPLYPEGLLVGRRDAVHTGPATILCTVDGLGMREYDVEITQVTRQSAPATRSMVVRVTDPDLLAKTGGIVQGMSGSPIIQDGKLVGAVTHVFVNDPTRGYGLYIEWMLPNAAK